MLLMTSLALRAMLRSTDTERNFKCLSGISVALAHYTYVFRKVTTAAMSMILFFFSFGFSLVLAYLCLGQLCGGGVPRFPPKLSVVNNKIKV